MINILIPMAAKNQFFPENEYPYPRFLIEFNGKTMIEHVINNLSNLADEVQFIFIINEEDCQKFHLDNILGLLTNQACKIIKINKETRGAACSALLAIEYINNTTPLVISNADQIFDIDLKDAIQHFKACSGGVICFESVHPRWSYARIGSEGIITETSEKRPISKSAIAGFYYFSQGRDFVSSAMQMIKKDASVNGNFFIAPVLNEMVLDNKKMTTHSIPNNHYHTFYTPSKIQEFERGQQ